MQYIVCSIFYFYSIEYVHVSEETSGTLFVFSLLFWSWKRKVISWPNRYGAPCALLCLCPLSPDLSPIAPPRSATTCPAWPGPALLSAALLRPWDTRV